MEFQAALETAMVNTLLAENMQVNDIGTGKAIALTKNNVARMYDGRPRPTMGNWFVSVWGRNWKKNQMRTCIDEYFRCLVTVTRRFDNRSFDHWVNFRDEVDILVQQIIAVGHRDSWNWVISNAMKALGPFTDDPANVTARISTAEALQFEEASDVQDVGLDWFNAKTVEQGSVLNCGCQATIRFSPMRRVQNILTQR